MKQAAQSLLNGLLLGRELGCQDSLVIPCALNPLALKVVQHCIDFGAGAGPQSSFEAKGLSNLWLSNFKKTTRAGSWGCACQAA